jgi:hypothetical protein
MKNYTSCSTRMLVPIHRFATVSRCIGLLRSAVLAATLGSAVPLLAADETTPAGVLSPTVPAKIEGRTYADWSEEWWQWNFSLATTHHPLFDTADVSAGQRGKVWFLGGDPTGTRSPDVRNAVIPKGKILFFPIVNVWADNTDCNQSGQRISDGNTTAALRSFVKSVSDTAHNLSCAIDGIAVDGLSDAVNTPFRVQTPSPNGFSYSLPSQNNFLNFLGASCWSNTNGAPIRVDAKTYHPVGDGIYIMVAPLAPGAHTIHFHGEQVFFGNNFVQDITYNLMVQGDDSE